MSAQEYEYLAETQETEQVAAAKVGDVNRDDPVKDFQKLLPGCALPEHDQRGQNQQVKQEEHGPGYLFQACVLPRFPAGKKSKIFLLSLATEK